LFQVGWSFALGIAFAIITCAPTSGGHCKTPLSKPKVHRNTFLIQDYRAVNPAITICFATWQGFPWKKVPYYIFAQIFGAFVAGLLMVGMYWQQLSAFAEATRAAGEGTVFNGGPASVLCSFPAETQSLGYLFFIEFFVDSYIGIVIWATLDPANPFIAPAGAPFVIGLAYATMVSSSRTGMVLGSEWSLIMTDGVRSGLSRTLRLVRIWQEIWGRGLLRRSFMVER
jgi:glycerol uptake facilitator-like aquaporin